MNPEWFSDLNSDGISFSAIGEYFEGSPPTPILKHILALQDKDLKPFATELLSAAELPKVLEEAMFELRQGLRAYFQFQDILDVAIELDDVDTANAILFNRHYCYYESQVYLREGIVSWLDRNVLAALTLLRPALELSILHLYWYVRCRNKSYKPYYNWLNGGQEHPGFRNIVAYIFAHMPARDAISEQRSREMQTEIKNLYKTLCAYNHAPRLDESIAAASGGPGATTFEKFLFAIYTTNILIRILVYLYILVYPMSLFPVDIYARLGFQGPVGLLFDRQNFAILEVYIGQENIQAFRRALGKLSAVTGLLEWFDNFPPLSPEEIEMSAQRFFQGKDDPLEWGKRLAQFSAYTRATGWFMNYNLDEIAVQAGPEAAFLQMHRRLKNWSL